MIDLSRFEEDMQSDDEVNIFFRKLSYKEKIPLRGISDE